jgi:hypothetical protein
MPIAVPAMAAVATQHEVAQRPADGKPPIIADLVDIWAKGYASGQRKTPGLTVLITPDLFGIMRVAARRAFHPRAQRTAFRRRDAHQRRSSFGPRNQGLSHSPNSNRLLLRRLTHRAIHF